MDKIALYAISLNQSEFVDKWMKTAGEADGIYVLDTGSMDNTVRKLKNQNVTVGIYKGDVVRYDDARNQALKMVPEEYAFCLTCDLNDDLPRGWVKCLRKKIRSHPDIMAYTLRNHFNNRLISEVNRKWIHKRHIAFNWKYPVNEVFQPLDPCLKFEATDSGLVVYHHEKRARKKYNYMELLNLGLSENAGDGHLLHCLAVEYMTCGKYGDALRLFREHAGMNCCGVERAESMRYIAALTGDYREKVYWLDRAIAEDPAGKEHRLDLACAYLKARDWENVISTCLELLQMKETTDYITYSLDWRAKASEFSAYAWSRLNNYKLARRYAKKALAGQECSKHLIAGYPVYKEKYMQAGRRGNLPYQRNPGTPGVCREEFPGFAPAAPGMETGRASTENLHLVKRDKEPLFCLIPFTHLILSTNGVKCCTWLIEKEDINFVSPEMPGNLEEIWQHEALQRVRESIRDGSYRHCRLAFCPEVRGECRNLLSMAEIKEKYPLIADFLEGRNRKYTEDPLFVNISNDTSCNLNCPSCCRCILPEFKYSAKYKSLEALKIFGRSIRTIFLAGMGEPFFSPVYVNWIKRFQSRDFPALEEIVINTNVQMLTRERWHNLPADFRDKIKTVITSIDGASAPTYEKNRPGGTFKTLLENLLLLKELRENGSINTLKLYYVYQLNNYREMPEMIRIAMRYAFDNIFFARLSDWGSFSQRQFNKLDVGNSRNSHYRSLIKIREEVEAIRKKISSPVITFMK